MIEKLKWHVNSLTNLLGMPYMQPMHDNVYVTNLRRMLMSQVMWADQAIAELRDGKNACDTIHRMIQTDHGELKQFTNYIKSLS
jgi:hypothetical protein